MITARDNKGRRILAMKNADGSFPGAFCPCCKKRVLARVGEIVRPHWAHSSGERCDEWMEEESEWRDEWIRQFLESPHADVENVLDVNGERHFYDVRFLESLVIVFRRKRLSFEQIVSREKFFGNMLWLVEGSNSEYKRFVQNSQEICLQPMIGCKSCFRYWCYSLNDKSFFARWETSSRPVLFDFNMASSGEECSLWCVMPSNADGSRIVLKFPRQIFLNRLIKNGRLFDQDVEEVKSNIIQQNRLAKCRKIVEEQTRQSKASLVTYIPKPITAEPVQKPVVKPAVETDVDPEDDSVRKLEVEKLMEKYIRLGFSSSDARARAEMKCNQSRIG